MTKVDGTGGTRGRRSCWGRNDVVAMPRPSMGSEDFAVYLEHVPGIDVSAGCGRRDGTLARACTRRRSTWTSGASAVGAKILARTVVEWSRTGCSCSRSY